MEEGKIRSELYSAENPIFLPGRNIFDKFYPDLSENLRRRIDRVIGNTVNALLQPPYNYGIDLAGSLARRLCEDSIGLNDPNIERVRRRFVQMRQAAPNNQVIGDLARGPYDIDLRVAKDNIDFDQFGNEFLNVVMVNVFNNEIPAEEITETVDVDGRRSLISKYDDESIIEASFGQVKTNPTASAGKISFIEKGREVFVIDIGFHPQSYPAAMSDRRSGYRTSDKSKIALPLEIIADGIGITANSESKQTRILRNPDNFEATALSEDIASETELALRAVRIAIFHHKEEGNTNIYSQLFTNEAWYRLEDIFTKATQAFSENLPVEAMQKVFLKEALICLEADPYLFLLIAEKTGLLRIFPYFRNMPVYFVRDILTREAFFASDDLMIHNPRNPRIQVILPPYMRNQQALLNTRRAWNSREDKISGLKIFINSLNDVFTSLRSPELDKREEKQLLSILSFSPPEIDFERRVIKAADNVYYSRYIDLLIQRRARKAHADKVRFENYINNTFDNHFIERRPMLLQEYYAKLLSLWGILTPIDDNFFTFTPPRILKSIYGEKQPYEVEALNDWALEIIRQKLILIFETRSRTDDDRRVKTHIKRLIRQQEGNYDKAIDQATQLYFTEKACSFYPLLDINHQPNSRVGPINPAAVIYCPPAGSEFIRFQ